ncbi:hypothetical protein [Algoriphagus zhangzhouensis]|uniref:Uncharacterized protein n=1 Tax=Algoriphagus zhangzhouensis TaxID=1073327 RepID=A0A1M7Z9H5_9BACT|nr:hypothetical protein [Algoriphagus zhangzhouensis]TDY47465.1 hypothetical protein A8938_1920 [Algoriphagus zhangzhouensis]SHO61440.1 hypothetical protein SAMN04488108_1343 [Algoriphagus zhangzhouensis]
MKSTLFFWMLFLPLTINASTALDQLFEKRGQLYFELKNQANTESFGIQFTSNGDASLMRKIMEIDNAIIQKLQLEQSIVDAEELTDAEKYKTIAFSQEKDIQHLKSALERKTQEYNQSGFEIRKFRHGTWIFFFGMLFFCSLYLKDKINLRDWKGKIFSLIPSESH